MAGWNLHEGNYRKEKISEDEIWHCFNYIFSTKSVNTTSYKFCFVKALLENIFNVDQNGTLHFDDIFVRFTEVYWSLIVKFKLIQVNKSFRKSKVEMIIEEFCIKYLISDAISFEALRDDIKIELVKKVSAECSKNVIGAIYSDSKGILYGFSKKTRTIKFNPSVLIFIRKYKEVITKLNYFEWIKFLEKVNPEENVYAIAAKLDIASKRNNLSAYRDILYYDFSKNKCFYCNKVIQSNRYVEIDHFIPWSFVKDDKIWNFVVSCRACNNSKRDKLAVKNYVEKIKYQNAEIVIGQDKNILIKKELKIYIPHKIDEMYNSAVFNGFDYDWRPRIIS